MDPLIAVYSGELELSPGGEYPYAALSVSGDRLSVFVGTLDESASVVFSVEETPDVLMAIQTWIERLSPVQSVTEKLRERSAFNAELTDAAIVQAACREYGPVDQSRSESDHVTDMRHALIAARLLVSSEGKGL